MFITIWQAKTATNPTDPSLLFILLDLHFK